MLVDNDDVIIMLLILLENELNLLYGVCIVKIS